MFFKKSTSPKVKRTNGSDYADTLRQMTATTKRATVMAASANASVLDGLNTLCKQATERRYY